MSGDRNKKTEKQKETADIDRAKEYIEKKLTLAGQRNTRVITVDTALTAIYAANLRQYDMAYVTFKKKLGEHNGIPYDKGEELIKRSQQLAVEFSEHTRELCGLSGHKYYPPRGLDMLIGEADAS